MLGPLLFIIYVCDMMIIPPYVSSSNLDAVIKKLEEITNNLLQWFKNNHMKANADKSHLPATGNVTMQPL